MHLRKVDAEGNASGNDVVVEGQDPWGLAIHGDEWGVLVRRDRYVLKLVVVHPDGSRVFETTLVDPGPQDQWDQDGTEWFSGVRGIPGEQYVGVRDARLRWDGTHWAAYHTKQRRRGGLPHEGDTLRLINPDGTFANGGFGAGGFGCSHSLVVRLTQSGAPVIAACQQDNPMQWRINDSVQAYVPEGTCIINYSLGAFFTGKDGDMILAGYVPGSNGGCDGFKIIAVRVHPDFSFDPPKTLVEEGTFDPNPSSVHMAPYENGYLLGFLVANTTYLLALAADLTPVGAPEETDAWMSDLVAIKGGDFFQYSNGDVGWVTLGRQGLVLYRVVATQ